MTSSIDSSALKRDISDLLSADQVSADEADRVAYSRDLWPRHHMKVRSGIAAPAPPGLVVWPESTEEVSRLIQFASSRGIAVVPYGAGSGVCGGILPDFETIVLDMKRMNRMLKVDEGMLECTAQAGMIGQHLEDDLNARGFTLGHFPSSIYCSTLGGWVAARSAGQCSGRYGKIEDMTRSLVCVDGTGKIWRTSHRGENHVLLPLMIGSEGTLSVITEATLRMAPAPKTRVMASFTFDETDAGIEALRKIFQAGLRPAVARLYDPFDTLLAKQGGVKGMLNDLPFKNALNDLPFKDSLQSFSQKGLSFFKKGPSEEPVQKEGSGKEGPSTATKMLVKGLQFSGVLNKLIATLPEKSMGGALMVLVWESHPSISKAELEAAKKIALDLNGKDSGEGPAKKWISHRYSVSYRQSPILAAGGFLDTMEVASNWSSFIPMYHAIRKALSPYAFVMAHFSHAYPDGASIYFTFAGRAASEEESLEKYDAAWRKALHAVVAAGGTFSHHHGVGRSKSSAMHPELGSALGVLRQIKQQFDPVGILNPGALFPQEQIHVPEGHGHG